MPKSSSATDLVELGRISGVFGVRGELRLFLHNRESDLLRQAREVVLIGPARERRTVRLTARSGAGGRVIARIEGLTDREEAASLKDWKVAIPADSLPEPGPDEFYVRDVLGAEAVVDGEVVGTVCEVHHSGPTDIFEVKLKRGGLAYAPSTPEHVLEITPGRVVFAAEALAVE